MFFFIFMSLLIMVFLAHFIRNEIRFREKMRKYDEIDRKAEEEFLAEVQKVKIEATRQSPSQLPLPPT